MVKNSTNINKTNNHLHSLNTKKTQHMILEIQILPLDRQINVMGQLYPIVPPVSKLSGHPAWSFDKDLI
jgi:hypothetical protein